MKIFLPSIFLALLLLVPTHAVDMTQPAQVQVTVQDMAGHPLPHAVITLGTEASADGHFMIRSPQPESDIFWTEHLRVMLNGFLPYESDIRWFPGAQLDILITLYPPRTTRLRLRGPKGEALGGVSVAINYVTPASEYGPSIHGYTDNRGDYVFTHPPFKSGFSLSIGSDSINFRSPQYSDAPIVTATLKPDEMPPSIPAHPLALTLIAPDGAPAAGWQIAQHVAATNFWAGVSVMSMSNMINNYAASRLIKTDKAGRVLIPQAEDRLVVISPQGIPFLYPLHPQTWPDGLHSVTLRLPPVRRIQMGQLTYPDGKPAANFPVRVSSAHTSTETWQMETDETIGTYFTDAEGRYALPQYFGTAYQYEARKPTLNAYDLATSDGSVLRDIGSSFIQKPSESKQVTLTFVDEQGKSLPEFGVTVEEELKTAIVTTNGDRDARGVHLFVPNDTNHLIIKTQAHDWNPLTKTLELPGAADQAFTITVPQSLHLKPLVGLVLAPNGKPVPGVTISLFGINPRPGSPNNDNLGFSTKTDAQGRFAFSAAPDSCEIDMYRFGTDDQADLPGWTDPPVVTPQARDMVIPLKPFSTGTVRALLPSSVTTAPQEIYLKSIVAGDQVPDYLFPLFDPEAHTLRWNRIPSDHYTLVTGDPPILPEAARLALPVTVTEGQETEIDLRDHAATFPAPFTPIITRIYVTDSDGKPVSGATVTLWTDQRAWERHLPADLTDDDGNVWLPLGRGQRGVAVAHVAGRLIGWGGVTGADGCSLSFGIGPVRTLTVPLKALPLVNGKPPYDSREVRLCPTGMRPEDAQAVLYVLGLLNADTGFLGDTPLVPSVLLPKDSDGTWLAQDLPLGTYRIEVGSDVTLTNIGLP